MNLPDDLKKLLGQAELDQQIAGLQHIAILLVSFYHALCTNGIPPELAADLVLNMQRWYMESAKR